MRPKNKVKKNNFEVLSKKDIAEIKGGNFDKHLICSAWPNCNIDPRGCCYSETGDAAMYGHKD